MGSLDVQVSTEEAVVVFAILSGVGGAVGQFLASRNLSEYPHRVINAKYVLPAALASVAGTALAAYYLVPDAEGPF